MIFNSILNLSQKKLKYIYENSLFLHNIDKLIFISIIAVFIASTFLSSDCIGFIALITIFLTTIKVFTKSGEKFEPNHFEIWLLVYFMIVFISLAGSTLFALSFKGFMKTVTYLGFYVSVVHFLKDNRDKIPLLLGIIGICAGFESIIGFLQNFAQVQEISTWQDVSSLNPEEVMTRVYGTLKPYNPNLLGGYFVASLPAIFGICGYLLVERKYILCCFTGVLALISVIALFLTGCRGSYIGCMVILLGFFAVSAKYLWKNFRNVYLSIVGTVFVLSTSALLLVSSLRARVFSIFAMRHDSSNSFRFNVYQSALQMAKDNWLVGIGVGNKNFREIYGLYMKTGFDALSAYNIFLETVVESGIFALIAFLGFLFVMIKNAINYILKSGNIKNVIFVSTAIISVIAVMIHGLVDTVFFRPQIQFVFWTMVAILSSTLKSTCKDM